MACSDARWNTVLKLMCLQLKASHQTFMMQCERKFVIKIGCATQLGHRQMPPTYATVSNLC